MRAADDIALAYWGLKHFRTDQPRLRRHLQKGAQRYFVRLQCGHLVEGIKIIDEMRKSQRLSAVVTQSDQATQEAFGRLVECLPGGTRRREFSDRVVVLRNKAAFHYDPAMVSEALDSRAGREGSWQCTITRGTELDLWRSGVADDIEDTIVCRMLWKIPLTADVEAEANKITEFGAKLCSDFTRVAGHVAFQYLRDTATI